MSARSPHRSLSRVFATTAIAAMGLTVLIASQACDSGNVGTSTTTDLAQADLPGCTVGASRCTGNIIDVCKDDGQGAAWVSDLPCFGTQVCHESAGSAQCVDLCTNGQKDGDEVDVDCGGKCAPCAVGKVCVLDKDCASGACVSGVCEVCAAKQHGCLGNLLRICKDDNSGWTTVATCDPKKGEACDADAKKCEVLTVLGSPTVTGSYYLFANFEKGKSEFRGGFDVDGYDDLLYVNNGSKLDVYKVELLDTDGDGKLEPNQHPDNPDNTGPKEKRQLTYLKTYDTVVLGGGGKGEIYAQKDRIYFLKDAGTLTNIYEFVFATGVTTLVHKGNVRLTCLGYDKDAKQWYGGFNSSIRRVFSYYPDGGGWALEFVYPPLAGSHLDGIEVVPDPKTGIAYVYASDMTSDFLTQYYRDVSGKWVQKNVFEYKELQNQAVEGMGFGAFAHFWITSGKALYEVGGGDLQKFVGID